MKPKSSVWRYYNKIIDKENHTTACTCRYCSAKYKSAHATRLRDHLIECSTCQLTIKALFNKGKKDPKCSLESSDHETASDSTHSITHSWKPNSQIEKASFPVEKINTSVEKVSGDQNDDQGQEAEKNSCEKTSQDKKDWPIFSIKQYIDSMSSEEQVPH